MLHIPSMLFLQFRHVFKTVHNFEIDNPFAYIIMSFHFFLSLEAIKETVLILNI